MTFASLGETEAVGADYDSVLQENIVADAAVFADYGVCVRKEIVADLYAAINDDVREQHAVLADLDVLADDHVGAEVSAASNRCRGMDDCRRMHARGVMQRLVEEFEGLREAEIGILDAQRGCGDDGKAFGNNHGGGFGEPGGGGVLGGGDEGEFSGAGPLYAIEAGDLGVGRTVVEARVEGGGNL